MIKRKPSKKRNTRNIAAADIFCLYEKKDILIIPHTKITVYFTSSGHGTCFPVSLNEGICPLYIFNF